jgi:hypothetical protein
MIRGTPDAGPGALFELFLGAIKLDRETYRRVAGRPESTRLCIAIVLLSGLAHGAVLTARWGPTGGLIIGIASAFVSLGLSSVLVWLIGVVLFRYRAGFGSIVRPLAIAAAPALFNLVGALTLVRPVVLAVSVWLLLSFTVAVRAALDCGRLAACGVTLATWAVELLMYYYALLD